MTGETTRQADQITFTELVSVDLFTLGDTIALIAFAMCESPVNVHAALVYWFGHETRGEA